MGGVTTTPLAIDQTYNHKSKNAQSGKAVAEALTNHYTKDEVDNLDAVKSIENKDDESTIIKDPQGRTILRLSGEDETVDANGYYITNVCEPVDDSDAATKGYVDEAVANAGGGGSGDLTDYVKKTDLASASTVGVVKVKDFYGLSVSSDGAILGMVYNADKYTSRADNVIISKGTLENVLADKIHNYELIEEITVTEDVSEILKTTSPNGTPYNFKAVTIEFSSEGVTGYSGKQLIEFNDGRVFKGNAEFMSDGRVSIIRGIYCGGLTFYDATWNAPSTNNTTLNQNGYSILPKTTTENVTKIHIRSAVKAGTVIKIYGIK